MNLKQILMSLCLAVIAVMAFLITSCKHKEEVYLGTTNKTASDNFIVGDLCPVVVNTLGPDMTCSINPTLFFNTSARRCYFNCDFNQEVTWTITITGKKSGAVKNITGTSAGLPFGNTISLWKGDADGYRFFQKSEACEVKIRFHGSDIERTTLVTIASNNAGPLLYNNVPGIALLDNVDLTGPSSFVYSYLDQGDDNRNAIIQSRKEGDVIPVDGEFMLRLTGQDVNMNTYLGGTGPELLTSHASKVRTVVPPSATEASQLYFNMYVYGTGLDNSCLQIRAYELDDLSNKAGVTDPLPSYTSAEEMSNDQWTYDVYINWTGWKLVSVPYTAFKPSNNPAKGGNGNRIKEPRKITGFNLLLQSMPNAGSSVETYVDVITLTWGAVFTTELEH